MTAGIGAADAAIYTGICLENSDPLGLGRIKYCVPQLSGTAPFGWAYPVTPGYTPIGAAVYVAFEGGDRNRPVFWHDQLPPAIPSQFDTYAHLIAAYPANAATPLGSTFYVADHGGSIQLQTTGVTPTSVGYQWLPNGLQGTQQALHTAYTATGNTATLIAFTSFNNPSAKRVYKTTATCSIKNSGTTSRAVLTLIRTSTSPASTLPTSTTFLAVSRIPFPTAGPYLGASVMTFETGVTLGVNYYAAYIWTDVSDGTTITSLDNQIIVEDVGAVT